MDADVDDVAVAFGATPCAVCGRPCATDQRYVYEFIGKTGLGSSNRRRVVCGEECEKEHKHRELFRLKRHSAERVREMRSQLGEWTSVNTVWNDDRSR